MKRNLTILHTADLHLGTPFRFLDVAKQKSMRSEQEKIFFQIIDLCSEKKPDFLVVAGDLFDTIEPEEYLIANVHQGFSSIPDVKIILNPGNHDYWYKSGLWQRFSDVKNVFIFEPQIDYFDFAEKSIRFHGKPFLSQSAMQPLWNNEPEINPKALNVLVQHGDLLYKSSKSNYNPLDLYWIDRSGFDFALLGHIHNMDEIIYTDQKVPCLYSGCPVGRGFDEPGIKGVYLISLSDSNHNFSEQVEFLPLSGPIFHKLELDLSSMQADSQLELQNKIIQTIRAKTQLIEQQSDFDCIRLTLKGSIEQKMNFQMLTNKLSSMFFYAELKDQTDLRIDLQSLLEEHSLRGDVTRYAKQLATKTDLLNTVLEEIGLPDLSAEQAKRLIERGYQLTMQAAERDPDVYED